MVTNVKEGPVTPPFSPPTRGPKSSLRVDCPSFFTLIHELPLKSYSVIICVSSQTCKGLLSSHKGIALLGNKVCRPEGQWVEGRVERNQVLC